MKKFLLLCFGILLANFSATGQSNPEVGQRIISRLKTYTSTFTSEKAYLNFDKPYYFPGDTIYFKAYLTAGDRHEISSISRVLHVDLLDRKNKINQFIKLKVNNGVAWGDFALPNTLNGGNYSIVAYTNWMRNDKNFFSQALTIKALGSEINSGAGNNTTTAAALLPDLQFFPESGSLVNNITSKVAFKAVSPDGLGIDFEGYLIDNNGTKLQRVSSTHIGMGYFYLTPQNGVRYKVVATFKNGGEVTDRKSVV